MNLALEFLIFRLNAIDGVETIHDENSTGANIDIEYEGVPIARVYASIDGEHQESEFTQAVSQVPKEIRSQIGWEVLMYRLSIGEEN